MTRPFQFPLWVLFYLMAWAALGAVVYRTAAQEYRDSLQGFDDPEYKGLVESHGRQQQALEAGMGH